MKLSGAEKLILIMLCEVYEKLGIKGDLNPQFIKKAIHYDKLWGLGWEYSGLLGDEVTPPIVVEVVEILQMWTLIEEGYTKLSGPEKETLKRDAAPFGERVQFHGFDANNEEHYGVAYFLIDNLARFTNFKGRDLNSHSPVIDSYRRMLAVFKPILLKLEGRSLSVAELTEILNARKIS